jgi:hypothetical protein
MESETHSGSIALLTHKEQLGMTDLVNDRAAGVNPPQKRSHNVLLPPKGLPVGQDWKVGADPHNVILYRRRKAKSGKEQWAAEGFYTTLGSALVGLVRQGVRDTKLESIQEVQDKIVQLEYDILKMAATLDKEIIEAWKVTA